MSNFFFKTLAQAYVAVTCLWKDVRNRRSEARLPCNFPWRDQ